MDTREITKLNSIPDDLRDLNLSNRAKNVCKSNSLLTLEDIVNYYITYNDFMKFRNCGVRTSNEIISFCKEQILMLPGLFKDKIEHDFQLSIMEFNLSYCVTRTCKDNSLYTFKDVYEYYKANSDFKKLINCGTRTNEELKALCEKYKTIISSYENEQKNSPKSFNEQNIITMLIKRYGINISVFYDNFQYHLENKTISLLKIIDIIFNYGKCFDNEEKLIIRKLYPGNKSTLNEIAKKVKLTRERIRQKKCILFYKIFNKHGLIEQIINIFKDRIDEKNIRYSANLIIKGNEQIEKINKSNHTFFSGIFIIKVLSLINSDYRLIYKCTENDASLITDVFLESGKSKRLKNYYFLKKTFESVYVINFMNYLKKTLNEKIYTDIILSKHDILINFVNEYKIDYLKLSDELRTTSDSENHEVNTQNTKENLINKLQKTENNYTEYFNIIKLIAVNEFEVQLENENLLLKRNVSSKIYEKAYEIIETFNRPMHIEEICKELKNSYNMTISVIYLHTQIIKNKDIRCIISTSNYVLKKWENTKFLTIKELVTKYISDKPKPVHISEIMNYVNQYRNTTQKNVMSSIYMDKKRFVVGKGSFVSLKVD